MKTTVVSLGDAPDRVRREASTARRTGRAKEERVKSITLNGSASYVDERVLITTVAAAVAIYQ